jgi:hypothetical protein
MRNEGPEEKMRMEGMEIRGRPSEDAVRGGSGVGGNLAAMRAPA